MMPDFPFRHSTVAQVAAEGRWPHSAAAAAMAREERFAEARRAGIAGAIFLARCPTCSCDPKQPEARCCDRIGCPIKHFVGAVHGEGQ